MNEYEAGQLGAEAGFLEKFSYRNNKEHKETRKCAAAPYVNKHGAGKLG